VNKLAILHDAIIFVGDGRKALFLRNDGDEKFPNLKTEQVFTEENPSSHEQGTDKPRFHICLRGQYAPQQNGRDRLASPGRAPIRRACRPCSGAGGAQPRSAGACHSRATLSAQQEYKVGSSFSSSSVMRASLALWCLAK
jgi:Bacterial archaeo-eukaryotic release factor family 12